MPDVFYYVFTVNKGDDDDDDDDDDARAFENVCLNP